MKFVDLIFFRVFIFLLALFLNGCTIQKRQHLSGYYVSWNIKKHNFKAKDNLINHTLISENHNNDTLKLLIASKENDALIAYQSIYKYSKFELKNKLKRDVVDNIEGANVYEFKENKILSEVSIISEKERNKPNIFSILCLISACIAFGFFVGLFSSLAFLFGILSLILIVVSKKKKKDFRMPVLGFALGVLAIFSAYFYIPAMFTLLFIFLVALIVLVFLKKSLITTEK